MIATTAIKLSTKSADSNGPDFKDDPQICVVVKRITGIRYRNLSIATNLVGGSFEWVGDGQGSKGVIECASLCSM